MIGNFLKVAVRALFRQKLLTLIKLSSLVTGLTCFSLVAIYVDHEMSYDRFHDRHDLIYRVVKDFVNDDGTRIPDATTPPAFAPAISREIPEVEFTTRLFPNWGGKTLMEAGDKKYYEADLIRVDSAFFDVFSFPFASGDKKTALSAADFIVITESAAKKYFGDEDPVGKTIKTGIGPSGTEFTVTAVLKDVTKNSHFNFQFLIPVRSFRYDQLDADWGWYNFYTYVRIHASADPRSFMDKLQPLFLKYNEESKTECYAQPLKDIHLKSHLKWELGSNGDYDYVHVLFIIAAFILALAIINYINLVTAQSSGRAKEVGVRKVSGARQFSLIRQFLLESVLIAISATLISLSVSAVLLPFFNELFNSELNLTFPGSRSIFMLLLGAGLLSGILAGIYPAFYISAFRPVRALKGGFSGHIKDISLRKGLVAFQFIISTSLILGIIIISDQVEFIRSKKLGFEKENILMVRNAGGLSNLEPIMNELRKIDGVVDAGGADGMIGGQNWTTGAGAEGSENSLLLNFLCADYRFLEVMGVKFIEGRNFSPDTRADSLAIILNETAVRQLGLTKPYVGQRITGGDESAYHLIGVIEDFHFTSFRDPIKPFGFYLYQPRINTLFVAIGGSNPAPVIGAIRTTWNRLVPDRPFEFGFIDEQVNNLYAGEVRFRALFAGFTGVTIFLACLGLFGLSAYMAKLRTKEIGIRKVLGAGVVNLTKLLSMEYIKIALAGVAIGLPVSWLMMDRWLSNFAYHIGMNVWMFISAACIAVAIALSTVSYESVRAALANPADSLRDE
jgi:putative ABC transport system permease protein